MHTVITSLARPRATSPLVCSESLVNAWIADVTISRPGYIGADGSNELGVKR